MVRDIGRTVRLLFAGALAVAALPGCARADGKGKEEVTTRLEQTLGGRRVELERRLADGVERLALTIDGEKVPVGSTADVERALKERGLPPLAHPLGGLGPTAIAVNAGGFLGVELAPVPDALREHLRLGAREGALVVGVLEGSPAEKAGLAVNDVLLNVESPRGRPAGSEAPDITDFIRSRKAGETLTVRRVHRGERGQVEATLGERPADLHAGRPPAGRRGLGQDPAEMRDLMDEMMRRMMRDRDLAPPRGWGGTDI